MTFLSHNRIRNLTLIQYSYLMYIQSQNSSNIPIMSFIGLFLCLNKKPRISPCSPMVKIPCATPHNLLFGVCFFLNNCIKSNWGSCVAFSCCISTVFFNMFLYILYCLCENAMTVLKCLSQMCCRISLKICISVSFFMIIFRMNILSTSTRRTCVFLGAPHWGYTQLVCPNINDTVLSL